VKISSVCAGREPCHLLKKPTERTAVFIAHFIRAVINRHLRRFQQMLGPFGAQALQIHDRRITGGLFKTAQESSRPQADLSGNLLNVQLKSDMKFWNF